jgi:dynein heavy chain
MGEMYGEVDVVSQEWTDGLASKIMRNASKETDDDKTWVVFDGPVDALWIENMNTVLDDNMTLCLANGQRIKLRSEMRMLFEVQDLRVASPATVSRCGMVYLTPDQLGWRPYIKTWISTFFVDEKKELLSEMLKEHLWVNFEATIDLALDWIRENGKEPIKTTDLQLVASLINILENFLDESKGFKAKLEEDKKKMLDACFAFSYAWGLGGALTQVTKDKFDTIVRDQFKAASIPPSNSVFDYWYDLKKDKCFKPWALKVIAFEYDKDASFFDLMVPTQDTTKYSYLLEILQNMQKPMMFTGNSGVGKSVVIQRQLQNMVKDEGGVVPVIINMSAQTSSQRTQQTIEEKVEKKGKGKFGPPPPAGSLAIFVDDINMPEVEEYGAQPPIELLRLFIDRGGLFNRKDWEWFDVLDANVIACAAPPGGGRAEITQRLTRRFNMFCLPEASAGTLTTIFASILKGFLSTGFSEKIKNLGENSISSTIEIY